MHKNYEQLFSHLTPPEMPDNLFEKTMRRIQKERQSSILKRKVMILSIGMIGIIGAAAAFIPAFKMAQTELSESGFPYFLSLIFSDFETVVAYWQNFIMSLLETLPVMGLATLLLTILVFLGSLKFLVRNVKSIFTLTNNA
ncbi:MAG: hypothetical protein PHW01_00055 [Patescibacteria group bacterium]|nr:hypothetical protein [Patescibacteria group bacterium]